MLTHMTKKTNYHSVPLSVACTAGSCRAIICSSDKKIQLWDSTKIFYFLFTILTNSLLRTGTNLLYFSKLSKDLFCYMKLKGSKIDEGERTSFPLL